MVKKKHLSEKEMEDLMTLTRKTREVKGLARKIFGFLRVSGSIIDNVLCLSTFFNWSNYANIGTIDVGRDLMTLNKRDYGGKAEVFAQEYERRFMEVGKEFVISHKYLK